MIRTAAYTSDGNRLASTTDAAGKVTTYSYNANTNVLEWVKAPNDTDATKTTYTYDAMYRMASAVKDPSSGGLNLSANYTYTDDYLTGVQTPSTQYSFTYGAFGQRTSVKIGSRSLVSYTYTGQNHLLSTLDYGNGDRVNYTYDSKNRVTKQTYEDSTYTSFLYDNCGQLAGITDSKTGLTTKYLEDLSGRSVGYSEQSSQYSNAVQYSYDVNNNITQRFNTILGTVYKAYYTYDSENRIKTVNDTSVYKDYTYDSYGRVSKRVSRLDNTALLTNNITYRSPSSTATTGQIATYALTGPGYNKTFSYTYDNNGNILTVSDGTNTTSYVYDKANQLTRENNQAAGKTWTYAYDNAGNILSKTEYAYTTGTLGTAVSTKNYTYSDQAWGDLLTSYNGTAITYDTIGNPLNDGTRTYTWERGRRLASLTTGGKTWSQTYNNDGLRMSRTNGTNTYTYYYSGNDLKMMIKDNIRLTFILDPTGAPVSITYHNTTNGTKNTYYYVLNPQGDVIAIVRSNGTIAVEYTYDAWGNILSMTGPLIGNLGVLNPFRYRGYIYDQETGLYYLQSRFYNPQTGRFINADAYAATGQGFVGNNMFAYCGNNPISRVDEIGLAYEDNLKNQIVVPIAAIIMGTSIAVELPLADSIANAFSTAYNEVREYCQQARATWAEFREKMPHVHHIVPVGSFSSRSPGIRKHLQEMQTKLQENNISVKFDPMNLVVVSAGTHAMLHTDQYIEHVYSYISNANNRAEIYMALYYLRLEIAAIDTYATFY